jgi:methanogenic corrinoid protein MtbC1
VTEPEIALRIGELARRVGVSPETLRAWERRYGLLRPARTPAGYRLYSRADEARAQRMRALIDDGWGAAQAAEGVAAGVPLPGRSEPPAAEPGRGPLGAVATALQSALWNFDGERAHALLDDLLATRALDDVLGGAILPVLHAVGEAWEVGDASVAQEHFASELLGGRLRALARGWDVGRGPRAVLACPSDEQHDLGLLSCGLALRERGWRITYLGADTPIDALRHSVGAVRPVAVVIGVLQPHVLARAVPGLASLRDDAAVLIGGAGAAPSLVDSAGAGEMAADPVTAAVRMTAALGRPAR